MVDTGTIWREVGYDQGFAAGWQAALEAADTAAGRVVVRAACTARPLWGPPDGISGKERGAALVRDQIGKLMREGPPGE